MRQARRPEVYELLEDYQLARDRKDLFLGYDRGNQKAEDDLWSAVEGYERLLLREAQELEEHPKSYRMLAFNQPLDSPVRADAEPLDAAGQGPARPWLRWLNPPDSDLTPALVWPRNLRTGVNSVAWSSAHGTDNRDTRIAVGCEDGTIRILDARNGQPLFTLTGHSRSGVTSVAWSPDGSRIVSGSWDNTVRVWDAEPGADQTRLTLTGHSNTVTSVAWSPDGSRIVSGSDDRTVRVWDAERGADQTPLTLKGHSREVMSVAWSPDGSRIVSGSWDGTVRVWNARTGQEQISLRNESPVQCVAVAADSTGTEPLRFAIGSNSGFVWWFRLEDEK